MPVVHPGVVQRADGSTGKWPNQRKLILTKYLKQKDLAVKAEVL
jgi:hypothetical protein